LSSVWGILAWDIFVWGHLSRRCFGIGRFDLGAFWSGGVLVWGNLTLGLFWFGAFRPQFKLQWQTVQLVIKSLINDNADSERVINM